MFAFRRKLEIPSYWHVPESQCNAHEMIVVEIKNKHVGGAFSMKTKRLTFWVSFSPVSCFQTEEFRSKTSHSRLKFAVMSLYDAKKWDIDIRENQNRLQQLGYGDGSEENEECVGMKEMVHGFLLMEFCEQHRGASFWQNIRKTAVTPLLQSRRQGASTRADSISQHQFPEDPSTSFTRSMCW
ncbi:unnamed protein product [Eruca vesicaria subsp. sativa]|uniref:Uncharacterized protein n=1 Tax=Eruca vesicaria subsp. sativa TaxID=29727 RepID=A0ABC8M3N1_ERUVS|nr:unnamed protein product [Eruca vesicaria subsp. sativa]